MILPDVNVLIYSFRRDTDRHEEYRLWLLDTLNGDSLFGVYEIVLASVVRICTHPKIFKKPSKTSDVFSFCQAILSHSNCLRVTPGERHWGIFQRLCRYSSIKENLIPDAYLAALAIESGCEWITTDRNFKRFKGLRSRQPLDN